MNHDKSSFCEAAGEEPQVGQEDPSGGAGDGGLEVLGETPAATEPRQAALHHPPPGQQLEALDAWRALDDFDCPRAAIGDGVEQLFAAIDAVGEDMTQLGEGLPQRTQQRHRTVRILDVGLVHPHGEQNPSVSVTIWRLRPLMRLPASNPRGPPLSVVGTLWLSIMPALGAGFRPCLWRARATSWALIRCQVASSRQR
jgi:hypothetical protein